MTPAEPIRVVLTGFMGTGKSTVGRLLATRLGYEFVDTDDLIECRHGAVADIFESRGEAWFRAREREVAAELAGRQRVVIATGGRLMLDEHNAAVLGDGGTVICLVAAPSSIVARVTGPDQPDRPLLRGTDAAARIERLLEERSRGYARFTAVDTDDRTPAQVVDEIEAMLDPTAARAPGPDPTT